MGARDSPFMPGRPAPGPPSHLWAAAGKMGRKRPKDPASGSKQEKKRPKKGQNKVLKQTANKLREIDDIDSSPMARNQQRIKIKPPKEATAH